MSTCTGCNPGETNNTDKTACIPCNNVDGYFTGDTLNQGEGCAQCPDGKFMQDTAATEAAAREASCTVCVDGKYVPYGTSGATTCINCPACPDQHYRTGCNGPFEVDGVQYDAGSNGTCVPCSPCADPDEVRVDCLGRAGYNNAVGQCVRREWVSRTARCPVENADTGASNSIGLGGFSFGQMFGGGANSVAFACSRPCDGTAEFENPERITFMDQELTTDSPLRINGVLETDNYFQGYLDTRYCTGPHACRTQSCSAKQSSNEDFSEAYMQAWACPMVLEADDTEDEKRNKIERTECQTCTTCGIYNTDATPPADFGRGCAVECTRVAGCDIGEIFDWTEPSELYKCKTCDNLRNISLCSTKAIRRENLLTTDVSGNRPKLQFNNCTGLQKPRTGIYDSENPIVQPTYGECTRLADQLCVSGQYDAGGDGCLQCHAHTGVPPLTNKETWGFSDDTLVEKTLYCQLDLCPEDQTGVQANGALCTQQCSGGAGDVTACAPFEIDLPCALPHPTRCVRGYPTGRADHTYIGTVPAYANLLESISLTPQHYASFENLLFDTEADNNDLHQCVWNAIDIRDNDMNPGGIGFSFLPPDTVYGWLEERGSKFCHAWDARDSTLRYPLLALQNSVTVQNDTGGTRRAFTNTLARVAMYYHGGRGYSGRGLSSGVDTQPLGPPGRDGGSRTPTHLDSYLLLDMYRAGNATLGLTVPVDRELSQTTWMPQWALTFYIREATRTEEVAELARLRTHLSLSVGPDVFASGFMQRSFDALQFLPALVFVYDDLDIVSGAKMNFNTPDIFTRPVKFSSSANMPTRTFYVATKPVQSPSSHDVSLFHAYPVTHLGSVSGADGLVMNKKIDYFTNQIGSLVAIDVGLSPRIVYSIGSRVWGIENDMRAQNLLFEVDTSQFAYSIARLQQDPLVLAVALVNRNTFTREVQFFKETGEIDTAHVWSMDGDLLRLATHTDDGSLLALVYQNDGVTVEIVSIHEDYDGGPSSLARTSQKAVYVGVNDDTSYDAPQYNLDPERLNFVALLAVQGPRVLVVLPVMRLNSDATEQAMLFVREYNTSASQFTMTTLEIDQHIPSLETALATRYAGMMSHAWLGAQKKDDIVLGWFDQVLRVRRDTRQIEVVQELQPNSPLVSGLTHTIFAQINHAYLRFDLSIASLETNTPSSSGECGNGFVQTSELVHLDATTDTTFENLYPTECLQLCVERTWCIGFIYQGDCILLTQDDAGSNGKTTDICRKISNHIQALTQANTKDSLMLPLFHSVDVFGVMSDVVEVNTENTEIGFYAFSTHPETELYSEALMSVEHADGIPYPLTVWTDANLWEHRVNGELVKVRLFDRLWNHDATELTDSLNTQQYVKFSISDLSIHTVWIVDAHGDITLYPNPNVDNANADGRIQIYQKISDNQVRVTDDISTYTLSTDEFKLYFGTSLLALHRYDNQLTDQFADHIRQAFLHHTVGSQEHDRESEVPVDEWLLVQRFLPGPVLSAALADAAGAPVALFVHVHRDPGDTDVGARRTVALDDVQLNAVLTEEFTWQCAINQGDTLKALCTYLYVPTREQLETVGLDSVMPAFNANAWQRLHVTVQLRAARDAQTGCRYRVFLRQVDDQRDFTDEHADRVRHLGCVLELGAQMPAPDALGECHVTVPVSMAEVNIWQLVGLSVEPLSDADECSNPDASSFQAVVAPYTQLYECEGDHYWSEDEQTCHPCAADTADSTELGSVCDAGWYVRGCAALNNFVDNAVELCEECPVRPVTEDTYTWKDTCQFECKMGFYLETYDNGTVDCQPCTSDLEFSCRNTAGQKWVACTTTAKEHCAPCDSGLLGRDEEFVAWADAECNVKCKDGFYRSLPDRFCRPCTTDAGQVATGATGAVDYTRLTHCTYFTDAARVPCSDSMQ